MKLANPLPQIADLHLEESLSSVPRQSLVTGGYSSNSRMKTKLVRSLSTSVGMEEGGTGWGPRLMSQERVRNFILLIQALLWPISVARLGDRLWSADG